MRPPAGMRRTGQYPAHRGGKGHPLLLEANLRPSGGIGYGLAAGCNLPALWAGLMLGRLDPEEIARRAVREFQPLTIRPLTVAVPLPPAGGEG